MISQDDIEAMQDSAMQDAIKEAQLHQFAAAALTGLVAQGYAVSLTCSIAWKHAVEMMRIKSEYVK